MKLTLKLIAVGFGLLVAALLMSLAAMSPTSVREIRTSKLLNVNVTPSSLTIISLFGKPVKGVTSLNVSIHNKGPNSLRLIYITHTVKGLESHSYNLTGGESIVLKPSSLLDSILLNTHNGTSVVEVSAAAKIVERRLLGLGVVALAFFIAGTTLTTVGVALRFSGLEVE